MAVEPTQCHCRAVQRLAVIDQQDPVRDQWRQALADGRLDLFETQVALRLFLQAVDPLQQVHCSNRMMATRSTACMIAAPTHKTRASKRSRG